MPLPSLLAFGPQTSCRNGAYFTQLREVFTSEPRLSRYVDAVNSLPDLWAALVQRDPRLEQVSGRENVSILLRWLSGEELSIPAATQSNTLTTVLTIITHLTQYFYYIDNDVVYPSQAKILRAVNEGGIQGFCLGLLSAAAVACSRNEDELGSLGTVALRLAFCIGAYVDLDQALNADTITLAVRWRTDSGYERLSEIMKSYKNVRYKTP